MTHFSAFSRLLSQIVIAGLDPAIHTAAARAAVFIGPVSPKAIPG
jgi:hypothetical protein